MVTDTPLEIKELLRIYNISPGMSTSIIPLKDAESRGLSLELEEPLELATKIAGYDALFSTGLSKDYVEKREFNLFISIRELLQNALDEEELISGRPDVQFWQDTLGTWIKDRGRGITLEALRMGESNKESWMRGYYGEGLKLAASNLTLNQIPVYIYGIWEVVQSIQITFPLYFLIGIVNFPNGNFDNFDLRPLGLNTFSFSGHTSRHPL
jgi:hypothetical protein